MTDDEVDISHLTDAFDEHVMNSDLNDNIKELLFNIVGDLDKATHLWADFLKNAPRDALAGLIVEYEAHCNKYYHEILDPLGIDYFDAPFIHHFYCKLAGVDLKDKYMQIGKLARKEYGEEE